VVVILMPKLAGEFAQNVDPNNDPVVVPVLNIHI